MKKTIRDYELKDKKVLIRVDFNVPMKNGIITDDNRIQASLKTIRYALCKGAKVILWSHLGRVKTEEDLKKNDLKPVATRLEELLNQKVTFLPVTRGRELEEAINQLQAGELLLVQNTRYEDLNGKKESKNDPELGAYWASLGDLFINDAFGTAHRAHASNVGIASHLPNGIGFLMEQEINALEPLLTNPEHPFTVILGGAKVSDKIGVIEQLVTKADHILIGGGMSYTFLKASGLEIGASLLDEESIPFCKRMLKEYPDQLILPIDSMNATEISPNAEPIERFISDFKKEEIGLDIGPKTVKLFKQYLEPSKTILWNGPVGMFELEAFSNGTKALCQILNELKATKVVGGGDTAAAILEFGYEKAMSHISTGGGASLEFLEGKALPGIAVIEEA